MWRQQSSACLQRYGCDISVLADLLATGTSPLIAAWMQSKLGMYGDQGWTLSVSSCVKQSKVTFQQSPTRVLQVVHCVQSDVLLQIRVVRIFNTYGPRMALDDGRVVSNFVAQALTGTPLTIYGHGEQTRSFQYVSDLIEGMQTFRTYQVTVLSDV